MIKIVIKNVRTGTFIPITVFEVSVENEKTAWPETFGSKESLDAFVAGVKAGAATCGVFNIEVIETPA